MAKLQRPERRIVNLGNEKRIFYFPYRQVGGVSVGLCSFVIIEERKANNVRDSNILR